MLRGFGKRNVVLLNRGERFADSGSEFGGNLTQGIQNVFFSCGLRLLFIEDVSGAAVLGAQSQHVLTSEVRNRAVQDGGTGSSLTDFPAELRSKSRIRGLPHQTQRLLDAFVGDETKEWRLLKLYRQPLAKRPVKHRVTGRVREIREDYCVLVRKFWGAMKIEVACDEESQRSRGSRNNPLPAFCEVGCSSRLCALDHSRRFRVP